MNPDGTAVFFYGLFMDESLLGAKGIRAPKPRVGYVDGYGLQIGQRATLVPEPPARTYGVLMMLEASDVGELYSGEGVSDYVPETVSVVLADGSVESATCYNLPASALQGTNPEYARSLLDLAGRLGLPEEHLQRIREQSESRAFPEEFLRFLRENTLAEVRVGPDRKTFLEIWMVEVSGRIFARSWNRSLSGWFGQLVRGATGEVRFGETTMPISGESLPAQSPLMSAIDRAYLERFTQPYNVPYAEAISKPEYHAYTVEILPIRAGLS